MAPTYAVPGLYKLRFAPTKILDILKFSIEYLIETLQRKSIAISFKLFISCIAVFDTELHFQQKNN